MPAVINFYSVSGEHGHSSLEFVRELFGLQDEPAAQEDAPAELAEVHDLRRRRSGPAGRGPAR